MIGLYYLGFSLVLAVAGPVVLAVKKKARFGLRQKLGGVPDSIEPRGTNPRIWFHTVSVGEFNATYELMRQFKEANPQVEIFISTTTGAGQQLAKEKAGRWATVFYFPFDLPWAIKPWLSRVQPDVVAIAESERWPGFMHECQSRGIKVCCVNARISPKSFESYQKIRLLVAPIIQKFSAICAQSQAEALRFKSLGASPEAITVCGNMKLDGLRPLDYDEIQALRNSLNLKNGDQVIVGGSTHEGEESALLASLAKLLKTGTGKSTRLVLAPRHPERFQRVFETVESFGFRVRAFSRAEGFERENDVYVLDTIGLLSKYYAVATVAFVGGTIAPIGGHNLVEPCLYKVPVICGPHTEKTRDSATALLERQALIKLSDKQQLPSALRDLLASTSRRRIIGTAGYDFLVSSQGAVGRTLKVLNSVFASTSAAPEISPAPQSAVAGRGAQ